MQQVLGLVVIHKSSVRMINRLSHESVHCVKKKKGLGQILQQCCGIEDTLLVNDWQSVNQSINQTYTSVAKAWLQLPHGNASDDDVACYTHSPVV